MWTFGKDTENSIEFCKNGEVKLQMIKEADITDEDLLFAENVVNALNECEV